MQLTDYLPAAVNTSGAHFLPRSSSPVQGWREGGTEEEKMVERWWSGGVGLRKVERGGREGGGAREEEEEGRSGENWKNRGGLEGLGR